MSLEFNPENRNTNLQHRRCSFCRNIGHNIRLCNSREINIFEIEALNYIKILNEILNQGTEEQSRIVIFRNYLFNIALINSNILRVFAIRHSGANTRNNIADCIELIIQHFFRNV